MHGDSLRNDCDPKRNDVVANQTVATAAQLRSDTAMKVSTARPAERIVCTVLFSCKAGRSRIAHLHRAAL